MEYRRRSWWKKCKERIASFLAQKRKEEKKEQEDQKKNRRPRARQVMGKSGRLLFHLVLLRQIWLCVNAAAEGQQERTETMERWQQQQAQVKESKWNRFHKGGAAERRGQDQYEERGKDAEMHLAIWISVEHREEVHEKVQRIGILSTD